MAGLALRGIEDTKGPLLYEMRHSAGELARRKPRPFGGTGACDGVEASWAVCSSARACRFRSRFVGEDLYPSVRRFEEKGGNGIRGARHETVLEWRQPHTSVVILGRHEVFNWGDCLEW